MFYFAFHSNNALLRWHLASLKKRGGARAVQRPSRHFMIARWAWVCSSLIIITSAPPPLPPHYLWGGNTCLASLWSPPNNYYLPSLAKIQLQHGNQQEKLPELFLRCVVLHHCRVESRFKILIHLSSLHCKWNNNVTRVALPFCGGWLKRDKWWYKFHTPLKRYQGNPVKEMWVG